MQVNFDQKLLNLDGTEVVNPNDKEPTLLRGIAVTALLAQFEDERSLSGEDKLKRWELALKIKNGEDPIELSVEEISLVKKLIGKGFVVLVVGQAWKMLEGK
jgi:hypothetical protein